ncbi:MAG: hypothetical protein LBE85_08895 [Candidatus Accumulibacter sp.]|jgi:hypothetical protein|nr:hypothetical protein [Accumulibacter sp.]
MCVESWNAYFAGLDVSLVALDPTVEHRFKDVLAGHADGLPLAICARIDALGQQRALRRSLARIPQGQSGQVPRRHAFFVYSHRRPLDHDWSFTMKEKLLYYFSRPAWLMGWVILVILLLYGQVLSFDYVWDDNIIFGPRLNTTQNPLDFAELGRPFLQNIGYFRPLAILTFFMDVYIAGYNPEFSHGVNLVLHILNSLLVLVVCQRILDRIGRAPSIYPPFLAALIYAVHPAMTETAAWISGRFDLLATFFILSATWAYISLHGKWLKVTLVSLLTFLALLCKETGALFPVAILCVGAALHTPSDAERGKTFYLEILRENAVLLSALMTVFLVYIALRLQAQGDAYFQKFDRFNLTYLYEKSFLALETIKFYLRQAFFPFHGISAQHPVSYAVSPWSMADILGNIATLLIMATVVVFAVRKHSRSAWIFLSGFAYLLLVLHIIPIFIGENLGHERFLATPLAFWAIAIAMARYDAIIDSPRLRHFFSSRRVPSARSLAWLLAAWWILLLIFTTFLHIPDWKNDLALWRRAYSLYPDDAYTQYQYFSSMLFGGLVDQAEEKLKALEEKNGSLDVEFQVLYGDVLMRKRDAEGLNYLEGIIHSVRQFQLHKQENAAELLRASALPFGLVGYAYASYSEAVLLFGNDPEKALELVEIARWYFAAASALEKAEFVTFTDARRIAYLYILGKYEEADALRMDMQSVFSPDALWSVIRPILAFYCQDSSRNACRELAARNIFPEKRR